MPFEIWVTREEASQINKLKQQFANNEQEKHKAIYEQVFLKRDGGILRKLGIPHWTTIDEGGWHKKVVADDI